MTMTQKILADHANLKKVKKGQLIEAKLDLVLGNDITTPVAIKEFEKLNINKVFCKNRNFSPFTKLTNEKRKKFYILQKTLNIQKFFRLNNVSGCQSFSFISDPLDLYQYIYRLYHKYLFLYFYVLNIFSVFLCFIKSPFLI